MLNELFVNIIASVILLVFGFFMENILSKNEYDKAIEGKKHFRDFV